jgi:PilZ domain-containing protein
LGPRDPNDTTREDVQEILEAPDLRGERLIEAIEALGRRHSIDSFRAFLRSVLPLDRPEAEARDTVLGIERHRSDIESRLGRDPGFTVAAFDLLHGLDRTLRDPVFRDGHPSAAGPVRAAKEGPPEDLEDVLILESRRAGRSGHPLAVAVLAADGPAREPEVGREISLAMLKDGARDVDFVSTTPAGDFLVLMPCTGGRQGLRAAERLRRALSGTSGADWIAGVASASGHDVDARELWRLARRALLEARRSETATALHRPERRSHARLPVGGGLPARLRNEGRESEIVVEDLSLGGALLSMPHRLPPGAGVVLAVRGLSSRPAGFVLPSRVLRSQDGPSPGQPPFRAAVSFLETARLGVAALLAGLRERERAPGP